MSALQSGNSMDIEDSRRIGDNLPISVKIFWIFFNIALTLCTSVVVIYWVLLHDYNTTLKADLDTYLNFDRHGVNLVLLIIDFCLHHIPLRFLHFVYPLLVSLVYLIFNVVYWAITEELIYSAIDWENDLGMAIGYSIGNLVLIIIAQFIWYWINQGKRKIRRAQQEAHYVAWYIKILPCCAQWRLFRTRRLPFLIPFYPQENKCSNVWENNWCSHIFWCQFFII